MHISFNIEWVFGEYKKHHLEREFLPLLEAVRKYGSLKQATENVGLSYRHAWGLLRKWEGRFHTPLVKMNRGRNSDAHLTEFGQKLLEAKHELLSLVSPLLLQQSGKLNDNLNDYLSNKILSPVRLFASHDMAITHLIDLIGEQHSGLVQYQTHGSLESLRHIANAQCEIAGFHFPIESRGTSVEKKYRQWVISSDLSCVHVAIRSQGLIIQKDNPKNISCFNDLAKRSVRFINRQKESGTRILFDNLLEENSLLANSIKGYNNEEFTHIAVAAMVASGAADVGIGIHAAANKFGLTFIPLIHEKYVLAFSPDIKSDIKKIFIEQLRSDAFLNQIAKLPGYDVLEAGRKYSIEELFG